MITYYLILGAVALVSWLVSSTLKRKFATYSKIHLRNGLSVKFARMLITSITITQDSPSTLYQVPFELTTAPTRAWKDVLMDTWQSIIQQKKKIRNP